MTADMLPSLAFFAVIVVIAGGAVSRMLRDVRRGKMSQQIIDKTQGMGARRDSAILSAEASIRKHGRQRGKVPFPLLNWNAIRRDLEKAGLPGFPPLVLLVAMLIAFLVARFVLNAPIYPLWIQFVSVLPWCFYLTRNGILGTRIDARRLKAMTQLIAFVESCQRAVSVGASPEEAVKEAIMDTPEPLKSRLLPIKDLLDLGYDFIDAISMAAERVDLREFDIFVASLAAQASSGGAIGEVLREVIDITRSRVDLQKKVSTMTGEGRFNAMLLGFIPIGLTIYLRAAQPSYYNHIWQSDFLGPLIFFGTLGMAVSGAWLAIRIAKIVV